MAREAFVKEFGSSPVADLGESGGERWKLAMSAAHAVSVSNPRHITAVPVRKVEASGALALFETTERTCVNCLVISHIPQIEERWTCYGCGRIHGPLTAAVAP